jgi:hypothetical protein
LLCAFLVLSPNKHGILLIWLYKHSWFAGDNSNEGENQTVIASGSEAIPTHAKGMFSVPQLKIVVLTGTVQRWLRSSP